MSAVTNQPNFQVEKNILAELHIFISGATQSVKTNPLDLSKTALSLLKTLPTARDAILEYFCSVFDIAVKNYIIRIETEIATGQMPQSSSREEATVAEIHTVLCSFVSSNPHAWAPIISTWSLELLGELSSRYAGRAHVPITAGLNETLQLWMGCRSTRTLIDITTQCLTCLMDSDSETWMNALLDTSVKHSPNFDWVVAHVGSCFPNTVITRVLSCGLKDFCQHKTIETGRKAPKLNSVVGILGHLAGSHFADIRTALLELFNWSLRTYNMLDSEIKSQKMGTVPFLLQLASMSPTLLKALSTDIRYTLKGYVILQLYGYVNDWCKYFGSDRALQDLVVNLILKCEQDGLQVITLLLDFVHVMSADVNNLQILQIIKETCRDILEHILQEMDVLVRSQTQSPEIRLLKCLSNNCSDLHNLLLSPDRLRYETTTRIIMLIGEIDPNILIKSACFLLQNSRSDQHLAMFVRLICSDAIGKKMEQNLDYMNSFVQILKLTLLDVIHSGNGDYFMTDTSPMELMWSNLLILLKWEKSKLIPMFRSQNILQAIISNMLEVSFYLGNQQQSKSVCHTVAEIVHIACMSAEDKSFLFCPNLTFNLVHSLIHYFFMCCSEEDLSLRLKGVRIVSDLLSQMSSCSKVARVIAVRELLDRSLFRKEAMLFGAELSEPMPDEKTHLLLHMNQRQSTTLMLAQRQSSIFHAGIIGQGRRKPKPPNNLAPEKIISNTELFLQVLRACCSLQQHPSDPDVLKKLPLSPESLTLVSLTMVQYISPDVMYNGLPWPEEDFAKVTIERDLYIRRLFSMTPLLWELMAFVAVHRPVLCYCSVVLRALSATLLHQWNSTALEDGPPELLVNTTVRLMDVLAVGQLLPPPLANMRDAVPHLRPHEMVQLLRDCVWNYMRDHIPSPALFGCDITGLHWRDPTIARPPPLYTDSLRVIMLRNIDKMGDQYVQLFLTITDSD